MSGERTPQRMVKLIAEWIADLVHASGARGTVLGLSGGVDSATSAGLLALAMGPENVLAVALPCESIAQDGDHAELVARQFGLGLVTVDLSPSAAALIQAVGVVCPMNGMARSNIKPRLRMTALYAMAQARGYLVCGNGNAAEMLTGYFTKFGDSGCDFLPLAGFSKRQVRALARELGVPPVIIDKPPSAGLWEGQSDEQEMGLTYDQLDAFLDGEFLEESVRQTIEARASASAHKRAMPPAFQPPFKL